MSSTDAVYDYLKTQNRPYNANDIVTNLKNVSKTNVQKALDKLVDRKKIFEKTYGKQKVYCVIQDASIDPEELMRIQRELDRHSVEVIAKKVEVERQLRSNEAELAALKSSLTIENARAEKNRLLTSIKSLEDRLKTVTKANGSEDLGEKKKNALKNIDIYKREYLKRKKLCAEMIDSILEGYPGTKKALHEEIGIEITNV